MPDAYDYTSGWSTCLSAEEGHNDGLYCNERVDQLLEEAERLPLLDEQRIAKYREIQDIIINQDVAWVALHNIMAVRLSTPYVHDDYPSDIFGGWPFMEELWMEEQ
jgi:ABC-type transport system substrate-binding protein